MKQKFILFVAILALSSSLYAGDVFSVGARAGVTYNDFWGDGMKNAPDDLWGVGFNAGVGILFPLSPLIAVHPGVEISLRRQSYSNTEIDFDSPYGESFEIERVMKQWNLDLPILARLNPSSMFFLEVGPMLSLNLASDITTEMMGVSITEKNDKQNIFELDLVAGVGVSIPLGDKNIDVDFRYILGLTEAMDQSDFSVWNFQLAASFWFM